MADKNLAATLKKSAVFFSVEIFSKHFDAVSYSTPIGLEILSATDLSVARL